MARREGRNWRWGSPSTRGLSTISACPRSAFPAASTRTVCRSACRSAGVLSRKTRCCKRPTPTSAIPTGIHAGRPSRPPERSISATTRRMMMTEMPDDAALTVEFDGADAAAADANFWKGIDNGPMQGVHYALKDIYDTAGIRSTCHSKLRLDNVPAADSVVETRFKAQGGVLLGKLATHEFALGGPSFDLPFPPARNPWNPEHIPGGSSSGSGAAVAAGLVRMAMGSDTGGSIRGPAAYCGTVGLKPTYGLVSRRGVFPLSTTLDHCGPLSWTVEDSAIALQVIAGYHPLDPASVDRPGPDYLDGLGPGVDRRRVGRPQHFFAEAQGGSPEVPPPTYRP